MSFLVHIVLSIILTVTGDLALTVSPGGILQVFYVSVGKKRSM